MNSKKDWRQKKKLKAKTCQCSCQSEIKRLLLPLPPKATCYSKRTADYWSFHQTDVCCKKPEEYLLSVWLNLCKLMASEFFQPVQFNSPSLSLATLTLQNFNIRILYYSIFGPGILIPKLASCLMLHHLANLCVSVHFTCVFNHLAGGLQGQNSL